MGALSVILKVLIFGSIIPNLIAQLGIRRCNRYFRRIKNNRESTSLEPGIMIRDSFPQKHKLIHEAFELSPSWSRDEQLRLIRINKLAIRTWAITCVLIVGAFLINMAFIPFKQ